MIFQENKVEYSLTYRKLFKARIIKNELGTFENFPLKKLENALKNQLQYSSVRVLDAGDKLSTEFPPGRLVELSAPPENVRKRLLDSSKHLLNISKQVGKL